MILTIEGKRAVLKRGSSFEYVSENRYFTDADAYTLAIELPLKDCPQNLEIFGHINRKDVSKSTVLMQCELRSGAFVKRGSIAIMEITDIFVKVQFLEGRSVQNCAADFDEIYINELPLGYNTFIDHDGEPSICRPSQWPVSNFAKSTWDNQKWQALPWVNNYSGNIQNRLEFATNGTASWPYDLSDGLSYQCYLIDLTAMIFKAVGYFFNYGEWLSSPYRYLLCCNTLPAAWNIMNYAMALPHWSVTEYIEQLELLMSCEFNVDHQEKRISMVFSQSAIAAAGVTHLDRIVQEYKVTQEEEYNCKYKEATNLKYAECDHELWHFYDCNWFVQMAKNRTNDYRWLGYRELTTISQLLAEIPAYQDVLGASEEEAKAASEKYVYYVSSINRYFTGRRTAVELIDPGHPSDNNGPGTKPKYRVHLVIQQLNTFHAAEVDEKADTAECKIVPAWLDDLGDPAKGLLLFLDCGELDNTPVTSVGEVLKKGNGAQQEFFDKIYVAYWRGHAVSGKYPHPYIDTWDFNSDRTYINRSGYSLALRSVENNGYRSGYQVKRGYKYTFTFLSNELPDVRSLFIIQGKRYLCEKVTATFTDDGLSELMRGEFYMVEED